MLALEMDPAPAPEVVGFDLLDAVGGFVDREAKCSSDEVGTSCVVPLLVKVSVAVVEVFPESPKAIGDPGRRRNSRPVRIGFGKTKDVKFEVVNKVADEIILLISQPPAVLKGNAEGLGQFRLEGIAPAIVVGLGGGEGGLVGKMAGSEPDGFAMEPAAPGLAGAAD